MKRLMAIAAGVAAMTAQAEMAADVESDLASEPPKKSEAVKDIVAASGTDATIRPGDTKDAVAPALAKLGPGSVLTIAAGEDLGGDCPRWITVDRLMSAEEIAQQLLRPTETAVWLSRIGTAGSCIDATLNIIK